MYWLQNDEALKMTLTLNPKLSHFYERRETAVFQHNLKLFIGELISHTQRFLLKTSDLFFCIVLSHGGTDEIWKKIDVAGSLFARWYRTRIGGNGRSLPLLREQNQLSGAILGRSCAFARVKNLRFIHQSKILQIEKMKKSDKSGKSLIKEIHD